MAWRASRDSTGHQDVATVKIHLLAVGTKMPGWVVTAFEEYTKRMPRECSIELREIPPAHRGKNGNPDRYKADEAQRILSALPRGAHLVVLDERGKSWTTKQLSRQLDDWMHSGHDVALVVGGPDGLDPSLMQQAKQKWSLSPLTLPHPMVRILLAEQLYRAMTILQGHPYHRE
jgi:23S rRNA (pseudouridine1915-N3)-methyltransferase